MSNRDLQTKDIEIHVGSVGLVITLSQSNWRISRRKENMEAEALANPLPDSDDQLFAATFYPLLAAPVISGNCPTLEDCLTRISEDDLELWYATVKELNPNWFKFMETIAELLAQQETSDTETKKGLPMSSTGDGMTPEE